MVITGPGDPQDKGGPSITLDVPEAVPGSGKGTIEVAASATMSSANAEPVVVLYQDGAPLPGQECNGQPALFSGSSGSTTHGITAFLTCGYAPQQKVAPVALVFHVPAGTHTYTLRYHKVGGDQNSSASFADVKLWVRG